MQSPDEEALPAGDSLVVSDNSDSSSIATISAVGLYSSENIPTIVFERGLLAREVLLRKGGLR